MSFKERLNQLRRLSDIKKIELNQAMQALEIAQKALNQERDQLERLQQYLNEYLGDKRLPASQTAQPAILAMRGGFIQQLQASVELQVQTTEQVQQRCDAAKNVWLKAKKIVDKLETDISLCLQDREQALDKLSESELHTFFQHRS